MKPRKCRIKTRSELFVSVTKEAFWCLLVMTSWLRYGALKLGNASALYKFGVVWIIDLEGVAENQTGSNKKAVALFGHYCSIITSLEFSPNGSFIVSADRDFKIRVSVFPRSPLKGVHEIQSFCLGHSEFVSCLTFVHNSDFPQGFLVSGSGDSTVCLWDVTSGSLLCTSEVGKEANLLEESQPAVIDLSATSDGSVVAVAIQRLQGILLLRCDLSAGKLSTLKVVSVPEETFIPTRLGMSLSGNLLWMVTGASNLPGSKAALFARIRIVSGYKEPDLEPRVLENQEIPGGEQLLEKLQGSVSVESADFSAVADTLNAAMSSLLRKKQYSNEKREFRKKTRNDKKYNQ